MFQIKKIISFTLFVITVIVYFFYPDQYNGTYIYTCGIIFLLNVFFYYRFSGEKKINYFSFDSIFIFCYFMVTMFYPLFSYGNKGMFEFDFVFDYNKNLISQATALATLGMSSYIFGSSVVKKKASIKKISLKKLNSKIFYILTLASYILFYISGGYSNLVNLYKGNKLDESASSGNYFLILVPVFLSVAIIIEFYKLYLCKKTINLRSFSKLGYLTTIFIVISIFFTGSRTIPMQIILLIIGLYTLLYKPMSLKFFVISIFSGVFLMFLLVLIRSKLEVDNFNLAYVFSDLIFNNRTSFIAIEYVNKFGYTNGVSMISSFLAPIPFLQSLVINLFDLNYYEMGSAALNTQYTLQGDHGNYGAGTNILADIYFSFGSVGIIFFMFLLGYLVRMFYLNSKHNIFYLVSYIVMISFAVFLVRAEFFYFLRPLLWSLLIIWIKLKVNFK